MVLLPGCVCCCNGCLSALGYTISSGEVVAGPIYTFITAITDVGNPLSESGSTRSRVVGGGSFGGIFNNRHIATPSYEVSELCFDDQFDSTGTPTSETIQSVISVLYMEFAIVCTEGQISLSAVMSRGVGNFGGLRLSGPCRNGLGQGRQISGELYDGNRSFTRQINSYLVPTECFNGTRTFAGRAASVTLSGESVSVEIAGQTTNIPWNTEVVSDSNFRYRSYSGTFANFFPNIMTPVSDQDALDLMHNIPAKTWDIVDLTL